MAVEMYWRLEIIVCNIGILFRTDTFASSAATAGRVTISSGQFEWLHSHWYQCSFKMTTISSTNCYQAFLKHKTSLLTQLLPVLLDTSTPGLDQKWWIIKIAPICMHGASPWRYYFGPWYLMCLPCDAHPPGSIELMNSYESPIQSTHARSRTCHWFIQVRIMKLWLQIAKDCLLYIHAASR